VNEIGNEKKTIRLLFRVFSLEQNGSDFRGRIKSTLLLYDENVEFFLHGTRRIRSRLIESSDARRRRERRYCFAVYRRRRITLTLHVSSGRT